MVIGICNMLLFDDDTDLIVLVVNEPKTYKITISYIHEKDLKMFLDFIENTYKVSLSELFSKNIDNCIVAYPTLLSGHNLYRNSFSKKRLLETQITKGYGDFSLGRCCEFYP